MNDEKDNHARRLDDACITLIAAWRNGHGFHANALGILKPNKEFEELYPVHITNDFARRAWCAVLEHEHRTEEGSYDKVMKLAMVGTGKEPEEWQAFWRRVDAARAEANADAMLRSAAMLTEEYERKEQRRKEREQRESEERSARDPYRPYAGARVPQLSHSPNDGNTVLSGRTYPRPVAESAERDHPYRPFGSPPPNAWEDRRTANDASRLPRARPNYADGHLGEGRVGVAVRVFSRFTVYSAKDALQPVPEIPWLVEGLLQLASVSIHFGKPGTKKTYALLWLAVCIALGLDWLGFKTRQSAVLIIDEESGRGRLHRRLHEVMRAAGADENTPIYWVPPSKFRFNVQEDLDALCELALEKSVKIIIVDSLAASSSGDENSKEAMQLVMSGARYVSENTQAHVALIHHSPKSDNSNGTPRGSSVFEAEPDLVMEMKSAQGSDFVTYSTIKNRDGQAIKFAAQCHWGMDADPNLRTFSMERVEKVETGERELSPLRQWILDYLGEHGESELQDILDAGEREGMGARLSIRDAIGILARDQLIYRTNPKEKGHGAKAKYALTEPQED